MKSLKSQSTKANYQTTQYVVGFPRTPQHKTLGDLQMWYATTCWGHYYEVLAYSIEDAVTKTCLGANISPREITGVTLGQPTDATLAVLG